MINELMLPNLDSLVRPAFKDAGLQNDFFENGYVILETALSEANINMLSKFWMDHIAQYATSRYISTIELNDIEHRIETNNLFHEATKDIVSNAFIDYEQYYGGYGVKFNRETTVLQAHQDTTMVPYDANRTSLTIWAPLIDVDLETGCVQVVPQSHKYHRLPRASGCDFAYKNYMDDIMRLMVPIPLKRGQVLVMDQSLIHFSGANSSPFVRVAVMGMLRPGEDSLVYYHNIDNCKLLEVFDVPDDFYTYHTLATRPENCTLKEVIDNNNEPYLWF